MASDNRYPFVTKAEVRRRLEHEAAFVLECLALMQSRHELRTSGAKIDGACGWMSSQRSKGEALAEKAAVGNLTAHETVDAARLLSSYAKQIAAVLREQALAADPSLAGAARVFGVLPPGAARANHQPKAGRIPGTPRAEGPSAQEPEVDEQSDAEQDPCADGEPEGGEQDDDIELRDLVLSHLSTAPALRSEEIAKVTGVTTAMLSPVLRELVTAGRLCSSGVGRGTRYTAR